jgi:hypothetical protein
MKLVNVRISPTIALEYSVRCPDHIPDQIHGAGIYALTLAEAIAVAEDAEFNSDKTAFDCEFGMPLSAFNAYRALAKQIRVAIAKTTESEL